MHSRWTPGGLLMQFQESTWTPDGVHQDAWLSVTTSQGCPSSEAALAVAEVWSCALQYWSTHRLQYGIKNVGTITFLIYPTLPSQVLIVSTFLQLIWLPRCVPSARHSK